MLLFIYCDFQATPINNYHGNWMHLITIISTYVRLQLKYSKERAEEDAQLTPSSYVFVVEISCKSG